MGEPQNQEWAALRIAIARDVFRAMFASAPPTMDMTQVNVDALARKAVESAEALLEALGVSRPRGNRS